MEAISIEGEAGRIHFVPSHISHAKILKIEKALRKLVEASKDYMTTDEMRSILSKKDPLIGTPGGAIRAYRLREDILQTELAKKSRIRQGHLSEMEQNRRPVGVKVAKRLAKVLRCDYRRFL
ncbi:MAG: helix-turn-helix transcriptional regulator [Deltaproteobacteria bacterium]|nr:helix-turn-helix transcriptional regulator [Deltaproteobacteria bacterium]